MTAKVTALLLAALLVAGSVTALAAGGRGGMGGRNGNFGGTPPRIERFERPEAGDFEKLEKSELTEEHKAEMLEKITERLNEMLANGEITEEQYNEYLEKIEAGEIPFVMSCIRGNKGFGRGKAPGRGFGGFEDRGNGFGRRPSDKPFDGEVEADEADGEVVEVRTNARKTFGGRNFDGMRGDAAVKF